MSDDRHEAISRRAYELWEKDGGVHGRHDDHWHQAAGEMNGGNDAGSDGDDPSADGAVPAGVAAPDGTTMEAAPASPAAPRAGARSGTAASSSRSRKLKTK